MKTFNHWVFNDTKTPVEPTVYTRDKKPVNMTNGIKEIKVDSLYTDKKLGIKRKGIKKRHVLDITR